MADTPAQTQQTKELPREVSVALSNATTFDLIERMLLEAGISDPDVSPLSAATYFLAQGEQSADQYVKTIMDEYKLDEANARSIAVSIGTQVLVPFSDVLSIGISEYIRGWGGLEASLTSQALEPSAYVKAYVSQIPGMNDTRLAHRLEELLLRGMDGSLSRAQIKERLTHSVKLDGMGLDTAVAEQILVEFEKDKEGKEFIGKVKETEEVEEVEEVNKVRIERDFSKEEKELEEIKTQKASIIDEKGPLDISSIVEEICHGKVFSFDDEVLRKRCEKLIESRVRDVRTAQQTRGQLERSVDKGGLGVTGRRLADIMQALESRVAVYQGRMVVDESKARQEQTDSKDRIGLAQKEEILMTKRYVALTGNVPGSHIAPTSPQVTRISAAISAHHEQLQREGRINSAKVQAAVEEAGKVASKPPRVGTPSMQEVVFKKRLSGPTQELTSLSLQDFRRLSKDAMQAATKVKDKVELLEDQGYDRKVEAIAAWRSSPLNQMYVSLTRDAVLQGTAVAEVLDGKRKAGEDTLSDEELKAVMQLNAELRF